jgi:hypothetical protein
MKSEGLNIEGKVDSHWAEQIRHHNFIRVQDVTSRELYLLFTDEEIRRAKKRGDNIKGSFYPFSNWVKQLFD